jgi:MoxR-like ATPase
MQLHRDTTVSSLTAVPSIQDGQLVYLDSPLVRAAINGRVLVLDEADKAPVAVVLIRQNKRTVPSIHPMLKPRFGYQA